jgi:hypothetical protein
MNGYGAKEQGSGNGMADFAAQYEALSDDEILRIAADRKDLLEEARKALDQEMLRRGLKESEVTQYQSHVEREKIREATNLRFWMRYGIGKRFFGKGEYASDSSAKWEEFDTTLWIVVFWVPLVPLSTFRIRRSKKIRLFGPWESYKFTVISRRGRDWSLILLTWGWFAFTIAALAFALKVLNRLL